MMLQVAPDQVLVALGLGLPLPAEWKVPWENPGLRILLGGHLWWSEQRNPGLGWDEL